MANKLNEEAISQHQVADTSSDDSVLFQDAMSSLCMSDGGDLPCPTISVEAFEDVEEAFLDDVIFEGSSNILNHPMLKHSQSDKCLNSMAVVGGIDRKRLLSDTKLVVLHYISGSCSSCTPSPSVLQSPLDSESDGNFKLWEADALCNRDRLRKRRFYRPRFNSTPAFVHHPSQSTDEIGTNAKPGVLLEESGVPAMRVTPAIEECTEVVTDEPYVSDSPSSPFVDNSTASPVLTDTVNDTTKSCRPKLKIDVIEEQPEFDFLTPEEKLLMDIDAEVSKTLSGLDLDDEDLLPRTPHTKVADFLQVIGKQYDRVFSDTIRQKVPPTPPHVREPNYGIKYNQFVQLIDDVTDHVSPLEGWHQIALYMRFGSALISHLMVEGRAGVTFVADYTTRLIFERAAGFLVEHGGWGAVANMSPTNPLFTSSSQSSTSQSTSPLPLLGAADAVNNNYCFSMQAKSEGDISDRATTGAAKESSNMRVVSSAPSLGESVVDIWTDAVTPSTLRITRKRTITVPNSRKSMENVAILSEEGVDSQTDSGHEDLADSDSKAGLFKLSYSQKKRNRKKKKKTEEAKIFIEAAAEKESQIRDEAPASIIESDNHSNGEINGFREGHATNQSLQDHLGFEDNFSDKEYPLPNRHDTAVNPGSAVHDIFSEMKGSDIFSDEDLFNRQHEDMFSTGGGEGGHFTMQDELFADHEFDELYQEVLQTVNENARKLTTSSISELEAIPEENFDDHSDECADLAAAIDLNTCVDAYNQHTMYDYETEYDIHSDGHNQESLCFVSSDGSDLHDGAISQSVNTEFTLSEILIPTSRVTFVMPISVSTVSSTCTETCHEVSAVSICTEACCGESAEHLHLKSQHIEAALPLCTKTSPDEPFSPIYTETCPAESVTPIDAETHKTASVTLICVESAAPIYLEMHHKGAALSGQPETCPIQMADLAVNAETPNDFVLPIYEESHPKESAVPVYAASVLPVYTETEKHYSISVHTETYSDECAIPVNGETRHKVPAIPVYRESALPVYTEKFYKESSVPVYTEPTQLASAETHQSESDAALHKETCTENFAEPVAAEVYHQISVVPICTESSLPVYMETSTEEPLLVCKDTYQEETVIAVCTDTQQKESVTPVYTETQHKESVVPIHDGMHQKESVIPVYTETQQESAVPVYTDIHQEESVTPVYTKTQPEDTVMPVYMETLQKESVAPVHTEMQQTETVIPVYNETLVYAEILQKESLLPVYTEMQKEESIIPVCSAALQKESVVQVYTETEWKETIVPVYTEMQQKESALPVYTETQQESFLPVHTEIQQKESVVPVYTKMQQNETVVPIYTETQQDESVISVFSETHNEAVIPVYIGTQLQEHSITVHAEEYHTELVDVKYPKIGDPHLPPISIHENTFVVMMSDDDGLRKREINEEQDTNVNLLATDADKSGEKSEKKASSEDSESVADDDEGMSLFSRRKKSKKPKTPPLSSSSQDYALWKRSESENKSAGSSPTENSHHGSCEDLPVLSPSPFGSLRGIAELGDGQYPAPVYDRSVSAECNSLASADSRSLLSEASSSYKSDISGSSSISPPYSQRLTHYNRHKAHVSPNRDKKRKQRLRGSKAEDNNNISIDSLDARSDIHVLSEQLSEVNTSPHQLANEEQLIPVSAVSQDKAFEEPNGAVYTSNSVNDTVAPNNTYEISCPSPTISASSTAGVDKTEYVSDSVNEVETVTEKKTTIPLLLADHETSFSSPTQLVHEEVIVASAVVINCASPTYNKTDSIEDTTPVSAHIENVTPTTVAVEDNISPVTFANHFSSTPATNILGNESIGVSEERIPHSAQVLDRGPTAVTSGRAVERTNPAIVLPEDPAAGRASRIGSGSFEEDRSTNDRDLEDFADEIALSTVQAALEQQEYLSVSETTASVMSSTPSPSSDSTAEGRPIGQPLIKTTPSSAANLLDMDSVKASREYRLSTEVEAEDESHLSPHTPVAGEVNVSYPNSDNEDLAPTDKPGKSGPCETPPSSSRPLDQERSYIGSLTCAVRNNWPVVVAGALAVGVGIVIVSQRATKHF